MKPLLNILLNGTVFCIIWIAASIIINSTLNVSPAEAANPGLALLLMWLCCLIEVAVIHQYVIHIRYEKIARFLIIFITLFSIQFVFTQMESWYYIEQQTLPKQIILSTVLSGMLASLAFALYIGYRYPSNQLTTGITPPWKNLTATLVVLGILVYPLIYFVAGYFIAWQWESLRLYYTGSPEMSSFLQVMESNFRQGIVTFQVARGLIWTVIGFLILRSLRPLSWQYQGLILGLLFSGLMSAQLLIPNPYMPSDIRMVHLIETASSNLLWGFLLAFGWHLTVEKTRLSTTTG